MAQPDHTIEIRIIINVPGPEPVVVQEGPLVRPDVPLDDIVALVAHRLELPVAELLGESRKAPIAHARQLAMLMARERTLMTLPEIGRFFNRRHTTIIYGCKATRGRLAIDPDAQRTWKELCADFDRRFNGAEPNPRD